MCSRTMCTVISIFFNNPAPRVIEPQNDGKN